jgi:hypothetical protein
MVEIRCPCCNKKKLAEVHDGVIIAEFSHSGNGHTVRAMWLEGETARIQHCGVVYKYKVTFGHLGCTAVPEFLV